MERCLSVVIPCYNEAAAIQALLERVLESPTTREVVVVDDGSTDGTRELLAEATDPRVRVILQPTNQGKGAALRRGFEEVTSPFVIVQDADLEYHPADYPVLLEPLVDGRADVVFGSRFASGGPHRVLYYWHSVGNRLLTTLSNMFTNLNLTDMETCYKAFRREVIQSIDLREDRFGFEPEVTAKLARGGWRIYEVGISYSGRTYDEGKKIGWVDGWRAVYCIVRYSSPGERLSARRRQRLLPGRARGLLAPRPGEAGRNASLARPGESSAGDGPALVGGSVAADASDDSGVIDLTSSGSVLGRSG
jgi:glycosyltransferase involved in cell wall biosynthesis